MSLFDQYMSSLHEAVAGVMGARVRYARGSQYTQFNAVMSKKTTDGTNDEGVTVGFVSTDFTFPVCHLSYFEVSEPVEFDEITISGKTYEVAAPGQGQRSWSYMDAGETHVRVHTVLKGKN